jgi:hypothetical protein
MPKCCTVRQASLVVVSLLLPTLATAQQPTSQNVGVVTAVQGQATVSRETIPQPASLRFKDDVFFRDQIATQERSTVRLLLGGKGTLTIREQSQVTLDESVAPDGGRLSVLSILSGKIGAAIARALMRPGDLIEIRTPNAVAAVRGTVLIAEYIPPQGSAAASRPILLASAAPGPLLAQAPAAGGTSNFLVISGQITITPQGLPSVILGTLQAISFSETATGLQAGLVQNVTPAEAAERVKDLQVGRPDTGEAGNSKTAQANAVMAATLTNGILQAGTGQTPVPTTPASLTNPTTSTTPTNTVAPVVPTVPPQTITTTPSTPSTTNLVQNPGFETGDFTNWTPAGAAHVLSDFGPGVFSPPEGKSMALIHTGTGSVNATTSTLSQTLQSLSPGSVYLVTFNYNFMSNEFPTQSTTFNDTFQAKLIDTSETGVLLASETRNGSTFKTDKPSMSGDDFTLSAGNGYTGFNKASKTVVVSTSSPTLEFTVFDVGDTSVDSGVLIDNVSITPDPPLYLLTNGQTLIRPGLNPLVEVSDRSQVFDSVLVSSGPAPEGGWSVDLGGPLLHARQANLIVPFSLLGLLDGSTLRTNSSLPLVWLEGGAYSLSTIPGTAIFDFWGTETALDPETGVPVGSGRTVDHGGPLLEASGGATVTTQAVLKLDTATLEAAAPIISLIGSATSHTSLTTASTALDLIKGKITSMGPLVALDKGLLNINNGPLLSLTQGSHVDVTGDLLRLMTQSKINIVNGPLVAVSGAGSLLNVTGSLVNFGGSGGNQIVVNNNITPTAVLTQAGVNGIGISATGGGSISVGPNLVKNPTLGTISVTGSLIQATNGGTVNIGAK